MSIDGGALNAIIWVLVIMLIGYACFWVIDRMGVPAPFIWIVRLVVAVILLIALLSLLGVFSAVKITMLNVPSGAMLAFYDFGGSALSALI